MMRIEQRKTFPDRSRLFGLRGLLSLLLAGLAFPAAHYAQAQAAPANITVSGQITDIDDQPLVGALVYLKSDNTKGMTTDISGNYTLNGIPSNGVLVFTYIGMENVEIPVNNRARINVQMKAAHHVIDEVQVVSIGYGGVRKRDLTGSVASIKGEELAAYTNTTIAQALQGRLPGVEVRSTSAEPGASPQIRVRGTSSVKGGNEPLWVVDGFPGMPNMLNPSDIESVEVLKDASATAIYGSRGSNGVIIVTTKQGREGKTQVDYSGSFGVSQLSKKIGLMDATQYMKYQNTISANQNTKMYFTAEDIAAAGKGTDWQDEVFRSAVTNDHSVSVKAGTSKTQIAAGMSFYDQDGIIRGNNYKRVSLRGNIIHEISKQVSFTANLIYTRTQHDKQEGVMPAALRATPSVRPYNDDGTYTDLGMAYDFSRRGMLNPLAQINERSLLWKSNRTMANAAVTYKPVEGLTLRTALNANASDTRQDGYVTKKYPNNTKGSGSIETASVFGLTSETTATYARKIEQHNFSVMGGMTYEQEVAEGIGISGSGFLTDLPGSYGIPGAEIIDQPTTSYSKWVMLSFFGRLNYSYKDKYLLTATIRADGSSRYSEGSKWGYFPSASAAWRVNEEDFLKDVRIVSNLKLRVGWGSVGNAAISPYSTLDLLTSQQVVFNKDVYTAFHPSNYYNFGLVWEKTKGWNVGVDFGMWNNRLSITADYYYKKTYDLLNTVELPGSSGYISGTKNIGTMLNKGFEFQVNARAVDTSVKWDISLNASFNRNKVVDLPYGEDVFGTKHSITILNDYISLLREGKPIGVFYGYVEDGYDDEGRIKYVNYDDHPDINEYDKRIIGNPNPKVTFGLNTSVSWKGFTLSAYFQGSYGNDIYSLSIAQIGYNYSSSRSNNAFSDIIRKSWTPANTNSKYPVLSEKGTGSLKMSDRFIYDGSYLRMRNIELAYSIPVQKIPWLRSATVYVSGQNLFTITSYPFFNPDVNTYGGSSSVNQGIDNLSYPLAKGFTAGLRIQF